jgi:hypothetical protein
MSQQQYEYKVIITTASESTASSIGMASGIMTWTPEKYPTESPTSGILAANWITPLKKSANVAKGGDYANIDSGTIKVVRTSQLLSILKTLNVPIIGARLEIFTHDGTTETRLYDGLIGVPSEDWDLISLPFETSDRVRNVDLTELIPNSEQKYSLFWGQGKHKLVRVETDEITTEVPSKGLAAFDCTDASLSNFPTIETLREDYTASDITNYLDSLDSLVEDGYTLIAESNGNRVPVSEVIRFGTVGTGTGTRYAFQLDLTNGNIWEGGVTESDIVKILGVKRIFLADKFIGGSFQNSKTYNFTDEQYVEQAEYADPNFFSTNTLNVTDLSGVDYARVPPLNIEYATPSNTSSDFMDWLHYTYQTSGWWTDGAVITSNSTTGNLSNVIDGDLNTFFKVDANSTGGLDDFWHGIKIEYGPLDTLPNKLLVTGKIEVNWDEPILNIDDLWVEMAINYKYGGTFSKFTTDFFIIPLNNVYPLVDGQANETDFRWGIPSGPSGVDQMNGFLFDLMTLVGEEDYFLRAGFDVYLQVFTNGNPSFPVNSTSVTYRDVTLVEERDYSAEDIFVDWDGRDDIDGTLITAIDDVYVSTIQLQNLENLGFNNSFTAEEQENWLGWGKQYPTLPSGATWADYIDESSNYGGIRRGGNDKTISYQLSEKAFTSVAGY